MLKQVVYRVSQTYSNHSASLINRSFFVFCSRFLFSYCFHFFLKSVEFHRTSCSHMQVMEPVVCSTLGRIARVFFLFSFLVLILVLHILKIQDHIFYSLFSFSLCLEKFVVLDKLFCVSLNISSTADFSLFILQNVTVLPC